MSGVKDRTEKMPAGGGGVIAGALVLLAALAFIPARFDAMNFFDPPKRLVWAVLAVLLSVSCWNRFSRADRRAAGLALALAGWMMLRALWRPVPTSELGVLFSWCLPVILFLPGLAFSREPAAGGTEVVPPLTTMPGGSGSVPTSRLRIIGGFLLAAGLVQALLMVLQRVGMDPLFAATTSSMDYAPGRMVGTIGYQNQAVDFLALSLVGFLLLRVPLVWFLGGVTLLMPVVVLTGYRGGILAMLVSATGLTVMQIRCRCKTGTGLPVVHAIAWMASVLLVTTLSIVLVPETGGRFRQVLSAVKEALPSDAPGERTDDRHVENDEVESIIPAGIPAAPAISSRLYMARIGWQMFKERPVTGWGAGEYALQYLDRLGSILPAEKNHGVLQSVVFAREAHNDPLQFAAEFGLIGVALLAGLILAGWLCLSRQEGVLHGQGIAVAYGFSYMAVASLFSFPWQSAMAGPLAGFLMGLLWPARPKVKAGTGGMHRLVPLGCRFIVLFMAIVLLGWYGREAYLNVEVPCRIAAADTDGSARRLFRVDYRHHALVGAAQAAKGQYDAALGTLRHARRGYRDALLWNNLGHVLSRKGEWYEARTVYEAWAASGLDHANALQNLSVTSEQIGDDDAAAGALSRRMRLWSDAITAHDVKRLAVLQMRAGDHREAAETLKRYRATWQDDDSRTVAEMENLAGSISMILGDKDQAAGWFRSALERYPELESARKNLDSVENERMSGH